MWLEDVRRISISEALMFEVWRASPFALQNLRVAPQGFSSTVSDFM